MWMDGDKTIFQGVGEDFCQGNVGGGAMLCEGNNAMGWYERARALLCGIEDRKELPLIEQEKNAFKVSGG